MQTGFSTSFPAWGTCASTGTRLPDAPFESARVLVDASFCAMQSITSTSSGCYVDIFFKRQQTTLCTWIIFDCYVCLYLIERHFRLLLQ